MKTTEYKYRLWISHKVLVAEIRGAWNLHTAKAFALDFKELANTINDEPWAHLVYLNDWQLGAPEIEPEIAQLVKWSVEHNLILAAQILDSIAVKRFQIDKMVDEKRGNFHRRQFSDGAVAAQWLESQGFSMS